VQAVVTPLNEMATLYVSASAIPGVATRTFACLAGMTAFVGLVLAIMNVFGTSNRAYEENTGDKYNQCTKEGVFQYY
jgi:hypothetical protein